MRIGAELVAAVDDVHLLGDVGQVQRLLDGRVAAPDDDDFLAAVEEPVAGGAAAHAAAHERFLGRQAQVLGRGAGGQDQRVAGIGAGVAHQFERARGEIDLVDMVEHDPGIETFGMRQEARHQVGALDAGDVGRPVVHFGGGHELSALGDPRDQHRFQVGTRRIQGRGITGRAGAQNQHLGVVGGVIRVTHYGCGLGNCEMDGTMSHDKLHP
jgi:hypothetical protein